MQLSSGNHNKTNRIDASADLNYKLEKFIEARIFVFALHLWNLYCLQIVQLEMYAPFYFSFILFGFTLYH